MYSDFEIRQLPLSLKSCHKKVEQFLAENGLRLEPVDYYAAIFERDSDVMLAGGGLKADVMKCVAVSSTLRDEGLCLMLISHLISTAQARGTTCVKVFTKPENESIFASASFHTIARSDKAILMENGNGLDSYCNYLSTLKQPGENGIIVMNANPFTLGHQYLIQQAAAQVDHLYVILVKEDCSEYSYSERLSMVKDGCLHVPNATVCEGSSYMVSAATFPSYFLKRIEDRTDTYIALDLDLYAKHIAPALGVRTRYVGTEPHDESTRRYNELMKACSHMRVKEIERLDDISASRVRKATTLSSVLTWVPPTTVPHVVAHMAAHALKAELDTTPKPGLVDLADSGSHTDMDHALMTTSIKTLMQYFVTLAQAGNSQELPDAASIRRTGIEAEKAMLQSTGGVNTHKGALFSMGLTIVAASHLLHKHGHIDKKALQQDIAALAGKLSEAKGTHGAQVLGKVNVKGALAMARSGYEQLFDSWLPFWDQNRHDAHALHKTLLLIMSQLDDTNVYYRCGAAVAQQVKHEAEALLADFTVEKLKDMNRSFIARNISPGGAADMLSLTVFIDTITR